MAASKRLFEYMREAELNTNRDHADDEYHFEQWLKAQEKIEPTEEKKTKGELHELFQSWASIFGQMN